MGALLLMEDKGLKFNIQQTLWEMVEERILLRDFQDLLQIKILSLILRSKHALHKIKRQLYMKIGFASLYVFLSQKFSFSVMEKISHVERVAISAIETEQ